MNKKIYIIFFILIGFVLNILFYILSDNYRYFMQSLKYDNIEYKVDDRFKIEIPENKEENLNFKKDSIFSGLNNNFGNIDKKIKETDNIIQNNKKDIKKIVNIDEKKSVFVNTREEIKLTNIEKNILKSFKKYLSIYGGDKLKQVELHSRLFDLTGEYPDKYFEYYGKNITLYFFGNKSYIDIKDIFEVLTYELPFKIKEVNNFGTNSFYINLDSLFEDDYIRIVIKKSNRTFGLKIKKDFYNKIKNDLAVIFKK